MKNRFLAALAALFIALGISVAPASPAQAAFGGVCADNAVCLYQWTGLGAEVAGNRWQSSFNNIINSGGCLNITNAAKWANGTYVSDNSASLMYRVGNTSTYHPYYITVFNWANCQTGGGSKGMGYLAPNTQYSLDNLNNYYYTFPQVGPHKLYHTITSIEIRNPIG
ncbi:MAG: hypothetical protein ABW022_10975 [Actinoplanes sp.]